MRSFNYSKIKDKKWDSEVLSLIASIYRYKGKQELQHSQVNGHIFKHNFMKRQSYSCLSK